MTGPTETTPAAPAPAEQPWKPKFNPWLIAVVVSMAAFMEVLDTSIANVALPHMAGNLGASNDESTWVLTSYLVSNAIVLPISGWLASLFEAKTLLSPVHSALHAQFVVLRRRSDSGGPDRVPGDPGSRRGRTPADGPVHSGRYRSASAAWHGLRAVRNHRHPGAHHRPDAWRLDYGQLFLALDFLYQSSRSVF